MEDALPAQAESFPGAYTKSSHVVYFPSKHSHPRSNLYTEHRISAEDNRPSVHIGKEDFAAPSPALEYVLLIFSHNSLVFLYSPSLTQQLIVGTKW